MKYIVVTNKQIETLSLKRLQNIYKINRKYIFQILAQYGFDTSKGFENIPWNWVNDDLYHNSDFNKIYSINENIKKKINEINN